MLVEQNYNIYNKKLLAIVVFLKLEKIYIEKLLEFTIFIDYKNFVYFTTTKQLNKKQIQ